MKVICRMIENLKKPYLPITRFGHFYINMVYIHVNAES